ncbi:hypothetical protein O3G_MSEX014517 [Manduca sexta]|uniref:Uncharacterized protein n=1 Tax=Manduca sexta TaxID=7130 RepID=A0A922CZI3_MANSE|nr:hypothetical protein O3G_MSEX014517 [Manduca sexta]
MSNFQNVPLKVYIQDIFRAKKTEQKYIYELFNLTFKNVMIHGVVTSIYNKTTSATNLELSDPTGSVQIYYDVTKSNMNLRGGAIKDLYSHLEDVSRRDENLGIVSTLMNSIISRQGINFNEGDYVSVVGDIFVDDKNCRLVSAYDCKATSGHSFNTYELYNK